MDEVKVNKSELLAKLRENKDKHVQLYKDALEGFFIQKEQELNRALKKITDKNVPTKSISFTVPVNREEQYDEAIAILQMSVDDIIQLNRHEFSNYVQDNWISTHEKTFMRAMALSSSNSSLYK